MSDSRISVVTYGRSEGYQIPFALCEVGQLYRLLTDFYAPDWLVALSRFAQPFGFGRRILVRSHEGIPSRLTESCLLIKLVLSAYHSLRGIPNSRRDRYLDLLLSRIALRHVRANPSVSLLCYSYYWEALADPLLSGCLSQPIYFFQVHPCASQIQSIVKADRESTGLAYSPEPEEGYPIHFEQKFFECLNKSSGIIAASSFTLRGLADRGINPSKMRAVPYGSVGVNTNVFSDVLASSDERWSRQEPLRLLWVGQLSYRKAPHHLFAALRNFSTAQLQLTLVTRSSMPEELASICPDNVRVISGVSDSQKVRLYQSHHLFVLPSLVEGFGLVYLEALAEGLPILGTFNSGVPDVIEHGVHGFTVDAGSAHCITDVLHQCLSNRLLLPFMSLNALELSRSLTWLRFRQGIRQSIADFQHLVSI